MIPLRLLGKNCRLNLARKTIEAAIFVLLAALIFALPAKVASAAEANDAVPEAGKVSAGAYANEYFGFVYRLPVGWVEDVQGPRPSATGYYSLSALKPQNSVAATLLIAAQDNFFAARPVKSAEGFLEALRGQLDPSLQSDIPVAVTISGRPFARLNYSGAGLHHAIFATEIRCHTLIFSATSSSPDQIEALAASLGKIVFDNRESRWPVCIQDYATAEHILRRVEPAPAGPKFSSVPTRIVIGSNGKVEQVHPIGGLPEQAGSIRQALSQWQFKPYEVDGKSVAIETGLMVRFAAEP